MISVLLSPDRTPPTRELLASVPIPELPPLLSDGIIPTSPIVGSREERQAISRRKGQRQRAVTKAAQKLTSLEQSQENKAAIFDEILEKLSSHGLTFGQLMLYVFDPVYKQGSSRWDGFFKECGLATKIMNFWVSKQNSTTARQEVGAWTEDYVAAEMRKEGREITASKVLQTAGSPIDYIITSVVLELLGEYSHKNNYSRRIMGLYLYATGTQRQTISVMAHLGISKSYQSITHKPRPIINRRRRHPPPSHDCPSRPDPPPTPETATAETYAPPDAEDLAARINSLISTKYGSLGELSMSMRSLARGVASTGLFAGVYDNINMMFRAAEQVMGRTDSQENGTCATIFPLWKAAIEDMKIADLNAAFDKAPPLKLQDIILTQPELELMDKCLRHCILHIIVEHGGEKFSKFRDALNAALPTTPEKIELHKTPLHPLTAWNIDESTIVGNAEVAEAIYEELEVKGLSHWKWVVKILAGDQLSIARLRSLLNIRAGNEGGFSSFGWGAWMPGLFHGKIADMHGFFCADSISSFSQLEAYAASIQSQYANADLVSDLRWQREMTRNADGLPPGDEIYENACLFLRDGLVSREFTDSIKAGDLGRVVIIVKLLALSFRGNGRSKYAYEMLHLIHNLTHVWPKHCAIILNNWLLNPTGKPFSWVEVDLVQEHMNFWIKAHGSAASWEWLAMVAPCITALRHLSTSIINILGSDQGTKHEPADLSTDIALLMKSLADNSVYQIKGRVFAEGDGTPTPDVITIGIQQLSDSSSNPLTEYNSAFVKLQARRPPALPAVPTPPPTPSPDIADAADSMHSNESDLNDPNSDNSSVFWEDESGLTAFERVMDEVDEPTLTRETAADVALNMDGGDDGFVFGGETGDSMDSDSDSDSDPFVDDVNDLDYAGNEY
ncbi:hypothetical protein B0H14DRAFT_3594687 [Mycena olivaceomarginata]|nr:hypothetical protein B0H14DRAFT_3594687 [Mycena olivaceomarginata]